MGFPFELFVISLVRCLFWLKCYTKRTLTLLSTRASIFFIMKKEMWEHFRTSIYDLSQLQSWDEIWTIFDARWNYCITVHSHSYVYILDGFPLSRASSKFNCWNFSQVGFIWLLNWYQIQVSCNHVIWYII